MGWIIVSILEKEMATHSSPLAWKIPWMEEPGRLQSKGSESRTRPSNFTFTFIGSIHSCKDCLLGVHSAWSCKAPNKCHLLVCLCVCAQLFSRVWLFVTPWTVAYQAPLFMGFFQARILEWVVMPSSRDLPDPGIEPMSPALQVDLFHCDIWEAHYLIISFKSLHQPWGVVTVISLTDEATKAQRSFLKFSYWTTK